MQASGTTRGRRVKPRRRGGPEAAPGAEGETDAWAEAWPAADAASSEAGGREAFEADEGRNCSQSATEAALRSAADAAALLREMRAHVDGALREACRWRGAWEVLEENRRLAEALKQARQELADCPAAEAEWDDEARHWSDERQRLREAVAQAEAAAAARRAQEATARAAVAAELEAEARTFSVSQLRTEELGREEALCAAAATESRRQAAEIRHQLQQQALLGPAVAGTAHLFVAALPVLCLGAAALRRIQAALDEELRALEASG